MRVASHHRAPEVEDLPGAVIAGDLDRARVRVEVRDEVEDLLAEPSELLLIVLHRQSEARVVGLLQQDDRRRGRDARGDVRVRDLVLAGDVLDRLLEPLDLIGHVLREGWGFEIPGERVGAPTSS